MKREPVAILALVAYVLSVALEAVLAAADVIEVGGGEITATVLLGVIMAVMAVIQRALVTPVSDPKLPPE